MTLKVNDIMDCIGSDELVAIFLEDDPTKADFCDARFFDERKYFESSYFYKFLKDMDVDSIIARNTREKYPILCIGLVC